MIRYRGIPPTPPVPTLYDICMKVAVNSRTRSCGSCKMMCYIHSNDHIDLPNILLFDFYTTLFLKRRLCLLVTEFSEPDVLVRMIGVTSRRIKLLEYFQRLIDYSEEFLKILIKKYVRYFKTSKGDSIDLGLRIANFLNEGGWFDCTIRILTITEDLCKMQNKTSLILRKLVECYQIRIYAEISFYDFKSANDTLISAQKLFKKLQELKISTNYAGIFSHFSRLFFLLGKYDQAFYWTRMAVQSLDNKVPARIVIDVLRQGSKVCVVLNRINEAGEFIIQALRLATGIYKIDKHPLISDTLLDYGFYLMNFDAFDDAIKAIEKSLLIRNKVFGDNVQVTLAHRDLAYVLYIKGFKERKFALAKEHSERAVRLMMRRLPDNHLLLHSAIRINNIIYQELTKDSHCFHPVKHIYQRNGSSSQELRANNYSVNYHEHLMNIYPNFWNYDDCRKMSGRTTGLEQELLGYNINTLATLCNGQDMRHYDSKQKYLCSKKFDDLDQCINGYCIDDMIKKMIKESYVEVKYK